MKNDSRRTTTLHSQQKLLAELRRQSKKMEGKRYSFKDEGILIDLAYAAAYRRGRHVTWRGIRFPLRHSLILTVLDPETGLPLIGVPGGFLL